jgi:hypothetical protein
MQRKTLLIVIVAAGSAMCWWPKIIPPNRDLPGWKTPLILIALITGLGTALSSEGWRWLLIASLLGGIGGICCGFWLWWPTDGIDASWVPFAIGLSTLTSIPVSITAVFAGVALRDSKVPTKNRRLLWGAFLVSFAFAPTVCAYAAPNHPPKAIKPLFPREEFWARAAQLGNRTGRRRVRSPDAHLEDELVDGNAPEATQLSRSASKHWGHLRLGPGFPSLSYCGWSFRNFL